MLAHTKKHPTESIRFYGSSQAINRLRKYARTTDVVEATADTIPAEEVAPDLVTNPHGVYLRGIRHREELTQQQLAEKTGIPRRHISEMEAGKRPIGKATAHKLAEALNVDYRLFL